jgi:hypothetical protein
MMMVLVAGRTNEGQGVLASKALGYTISELRRCRTLQECTEGSRLQKSLIGKTFEYLPTYDDSIQRLCPQYLSYYPHIDNITLS